MYQGPDQINLETVRARSPSLESESQMPTERRERTPALPPSTMRTENALFFSCASNPRLPTAPETRTHRRRAGAENAPLDDCSGLSSNPSSLALHGSQSLTASLRLTKPFFPSGLLHLQCESPRTERNELVCPPVDVSPIPGPKICYTELHLAKST